MSDTAYDNPEDDSGVSSEGQVKETIAKQSVEQFAAGLKYKEKRMTMWTEVERQYNLEREKVLQPGKYDYPLPVLSGYVDALHAKVDDEPFIEFGQLTLADKPRAKRVTSAWNLYSDAEHADWPGEDRAGKKTAIMTGRAIFITFCESDPEFSHYFELIDSYDYVAEALSGGKISNHRCGFQDNIFRSKYELETAPHYDQTQVKKLCVATKDNAHKKNSITYRQKVSRLISIGLDPQSYSDYGGDPLFRLTQGFTQYKGTTYWIVMDMSTGIWLRCDPIKQVFKSGKHPFVSWATNYDKFNFWSKAPAEDVIPVARAIRDLVNEQMYNIKKRNSGQRAYNPDVFDEPELLEWRPDGLVPATVGPGVAISQGIYEFKTEDNTAITVNLINFLDSFTAQKTGITAGAQGQSQKDTKVGVYYGDLQQVADRIGLKSKYYVECWRAAGQLFKWGLWEHFPAKLMVKVVGEEGIDWEELKKEDVNPDFAIVPKSGKAELEASELKKKIKSQALTEVMADPANKPFLNPVIAIQMKLRNGSWEEEEIRTLMDVSTIGDETSVVNASQAIEDILQGKKARIYRKAGMAFLKKLRDFLDTNELDIKVEKEFALYFHMMAQIVAKNVASRAIAGAPPGGQIAPPGGLPVQNGPVPGQPGGAPPVPVSGTPGGTAGQSQQVSNGFTA